MLPTIITPRSLTMGRSDYAEVLRRQYNYGDREQAHQEASVLVSLDQLEALMDHDFDVEVARTAHGLLRSATSWHRIFREEVFNYPARMAAATKHFTDLTAKVGHRFGLEMAYAELAAEFASIEEGFDPALAKRWVRAKVHGGPTPHQPGVELLESTLEVLVEQALEDTWVLATFGTSRMYQEGPDVRVTLFTVARNGTRSLVLLPAAVCDQLAEDGIRPFRSAPVSFDPRLGATAAALWVPDSRDEDDSFTEMRVLAPVARSLC